MLASQLEILKQLQKLVRFLTLRGIFSVTILSNHFQSQHCLTEKAFHMFSDGFRAIKERIEKR